MVNSIFIPAIQAGAWTVATSPVTWIGLGAFVLFIGAYCYIAHSPRLVERTPTPPVVEEVERTPTPPVGEASTPPVGEASTPPVGEASTPPVGEASTPPVGEASTPPVGEASTPPVVETIGSEMASKIIGEVKDLHNQWVAQESFVDALVQLLTDNPNDEKNFETLIQVTQQGTVIQELCSRNASKLFGGALKPLKATKVAWDVLFSNTYAILDKLNEPEEELVNSITSESIRLVKKNLGRLFADMYSPGEIVFFYRACLKKKDPVDSQGNHYEIFWLNDLKSEQCKHLITRLSPAELEILWCISNHCVVGIQIEIASKIVELLKKKDSEENSVQKSFKSKILETINVDKTQQFLDGKVREGLNKLRAIILPNLFLFRGDWAFDLECYLPYFSWGNPCTDGDRNGSRSDGVYYYFLNITAMNRASLDWKKSFSGFLNENRRSMLRAEAEKHLKGELLRSFIADVDRITL